MLESISFLKPANSNHSVKEAVITLFLTQPIVNPEKFRELLKEFKPEFQSFDETFSLKYQFNQDGIHKESLNNDGFVFTRFNNENGGRSKILRGVNEEYRQFLAFHNLSYNRWKDFFEEFTQCIKLISNFDKSLYVLAFSIHYVDEFYWEGNSPMPLKEILKSNQDFIPNKIFESTESTSVLITNSESHITERLEVKVRLNNLNISHNVIYNVGENISIENFVADSKYLSEIEKLHIFNKKILQELLTKPICKLINLI